MHPFPEEFELVGLFESEPEVLDKEIPLFYNTIRFILTREFERVECEISPSYKELKFKWVQEDRELVSLNLHNIKGLIVERNKKKEFLKVLFEEDTGVDVLIIQLNPTVHVQWGTLLKL